MKILQNKTVNEALLQCQRPQISLDQITPIINEIFGEVQIKGDEAIRKYTRFFDKVKLESLAVTQGEINEAASKISDELKNAIELALSNIQRFHKKQNSEFEVIETVPGVKCWQESRPIESVGIYVPGGTAPLFSTVLMLAGPAQIAACQRIVMCSPPNKNGQIDPAILYAAQLTGVNEIYKVGGAQAIAALALGTESIEKVYKIFGPGNQFVTAAKQKAQQYGVSIDMPAGPSELLVYADNSCDPAFVAADLLSQAEHGVDSQVICVVQDLSLAKAIQKEVAKQLINLPRKEIAAQSLENSKIIKFNEQQDALGFINAYAPEHLIVALENKDQVLSEIKNAGSVFIGNYTPESAGDYASGTNHTLPTSGFAKAYSGVNLDAFLKKITFQELSQEGLLNLASTIEVMAEAEQLYAHKNAVTIRIQKIENEN